MSEARPSREPNRRPDPRPPRTTPTRRDAIETRRRLFEAAGEAFAQHGYQQASLREICRAAGANLGSVKYYFGTKEDLYREVLLASHRQMLEDEAPPRLDQAPDAPTALGWWIEYFMRLALIRPAAHPFLGRILIHEITQPTFALDDLVNQVMQPIRGQLEQIVSRLAPPDVSADELTRRTHFVILLCVQHELAKPILQRFGDPPPSDELEVRELAHQIHHFALAGITQPPTPPPDRP